MQNITNNLNLKISRFAGILFLLSLIIPTLNWAFILSKFISPEGNATLKILNNELLFRLNIVNEVITSITILTLAYCLYVILKTINRSLSLFAFSLRIIEATLFLVLALGHLGALLLLKGEYLNGIHPLIDLLIGKYIFLTAIPGVFFGLSMMIFSYLFLLSRYIPKVLAIFGIFSYALVILYDSTTILFPNYTTLLFVQIVGSIPVVLSQVAIGLWLLCKGINTQPVKRLLSQKNKSDESNYL